MRHDFHGDINRNREREPHVTPGTGENLGINTNDFTVQVQQRTARVARVDRHVGLDKRHIVTAPALQAAAGGADNTGRHTHLEIKRGSNRDHPFTGFEVLGAADLDRRQVLRFNFDQRKVRKWISPDHFRLAFTPIAQRDNNLIRTIDNVVVRQDVTIRFNNETRANAGSRCLFGSAKETPEHLWHFFFEVLTVACCLYRADIHHSG